MVKERLMMRYAAASLSSFVLAAHHDVERVIGQGPLQRLRLVPWRAHIAFFGSRQDHRHRLVIINRPIRGMSGRQAAGPVHASAPRFFALFLRELIVRSPQDFSDQHQIAFRVR